MMRRLGFIVSLCLLAQQAYAYELTGAAWRMVNYPNGVPYCPTVNSSSAYTSSLQTQFANALDEAFEDWTDDGVSHCSAFSVQKSSCSGSPSPNSDNPWVYWEDNWSSVSGVGPSTIGVTPWWSSGNQITQAKVIFNDQHYNWSVNGTATDVQTIAVHEFGHFLGLDHYDEYSSSKRNQCSSASPPSVMCAYYTQGAFSEPSFDDIQGVCYLYPKPGALGASCDFGCNEVCHDDGYCTQLCTAGNCPEGYSCSSGQCERDLAPPVCPTCGDLPCGEDSQCMGASGSAFCTNYCSSDSQCGEYFECAALQGGGGICWPMSNSCDENGPQPGQTCGNNYSCALGNVCLSSSSGARCYQLCDGDTDCNSGQSCYNIPSSNISYCDTTSTNTCSCDLSTTCQAGCNCDVDCQQCSCNFSFSCESGCNCDPDCPGSCSCDSTSTCDGGCTCDPDCSSGTCSCDTTSSCESNCSCDSDCSTPAGCACDTTYNCDAGCEACDPECSCLCDATFDCEGDCSCDIDCTRDVECTCDVTKSCDEDCICDPQCTCECDETFACDAQCPCDPECVGSGCACESAAPLSGKSGNDGFVLFFATLLFLMYRMRPKFLRP